MKTNFISNSLKNLKERNISKSFNKKKNQILFEDDDEFLMDFEKVEEEADDFLEKEKRKNERKELKMTDHNLENYDTLVKNLYIETKEVARMTDKEV